MPVFSDAMLSETKLLKAVRQAVQRRRESLSSLLDVECPSPGARHQPGRCAVGARDTQTRRRSCLVSEHMHLDRSNANGSVLATAQVSNHALPQH